MRKTHDYVHSYPGISAGQGRCRVCIYEQVGQTPVVVINALTSNASTSISTLAPFLAAEIVNRHFPDHGDEDVPVRWFEHHERSEWQLKRRQPEFLQVEFTSYRATSQPTSGGTRVRIGQPRWTRVSRDTIEQIVEQALD